MKIRFGIGRIAIITKRYTLKLPKVDPRQIYRDVRELAKAPDLIGFYFRDSADYDWSFRNSVTVGFSENWVEARASRVLGDAVVPTVFSFLGIFNVQRTAREHGVHYGEIVRALTPVLGRKNIFEEGHTFYGEENFGLDGGKLKLLDYGRKRVVQIVLEKRDAVRQALDGIMIR